MRQLLPTMMLPTVRILIRGKSNEVNDYDDGERSEYILFFKKNWKYIIAIVIIANSAFLKKIYKI